MKSVQSAAKQSEAAGAGETKNQKLLQELRCSGTTRAACSNQLTFSTFTKHFIDFAADCRRMELRTPTPFFSNSVRASEEEEITSLQR